MLVRFVRQQGLTPAEVRSGAPSRLDPALGMKTGVRGAGVALGTGGGGADPTGVSPAPRSRRCWHGSPLKGQSNFWKQRRLFRSCGMMRSTAGTLRRTYALRMERRCDMRNKRFGKLLSAALAAALSPPPPWRRNGEPI